MRSSNSPDHRRLRTLGQALVCALLALSPAGPAAQPHGSTIAGLLVGPDDRPLAGAAVELLREDAGRWGEPRLSVSMRGVAGLDGRFEFVDVEPAAYLIRIGGNAGALNGHNDVYFPGVGDLAQATRVRVDAAHFLPVAMKVPLLPLGSIQGKVVVPAGARMPAEIQLRRFTDETGCVINYHLHPVASDGSFAIGSLKVGRYGLRAYATGFGGAIEVDVGASPLKDLRLELQPFATVRGRFELPGTAKIPYMPTVDFEPRDQVADMLSDGRRTRDAAPGAFEASVLGRHRVSVSAPDGWIAESVLLDDGTELLDATYDFAPGKSYSNIRVVLTNRTARINGKVLMNGVPYPSGSVSLVAFPDDERTWDLHDSRVRIGHMEDDGTFTIRDLRPGLTYLVAAYPWGQSGGREWFEALSKTATRVSITEPRTYTVTVPAPR